LNPPNNDKRTHLIVIVVLLPPISWTHPPRYFSSLLDKKSSIVCIQLSVQREITMEQKSRRIKRPCRICRTWFVPHPRLGDRQKTCAAAECQQQWHRHKCAQWNQKNTAYYREIYLNKRLQIAVAAESARSTSQIAAECPLPPPVAPLNYPRAVVQEVIGAQPLVIIEYIVRLLTRRVQEVMRTQRFEIQRESSRLLTMECSRGDSQRPPVPDRLCHQT
jgi:hypothetical protein